MLCGGQASASQAVMKADGLQIGEHTISVSISNPPGRRPQAGQPAGQEERRPSLGAGKKETAA